MNVTIITAVVSLIGILAVGVLVPMYLVGRAERVRREDTAEVARMHREDRDAEWARQDEVAEKAEKARAELAASQKAITDQAAAAATLLLAANEQVAKTAQVTNGKLDLIHTLVNSNMTAAMQSEFDAVKRELAVMRELMELKRASGQEPTTEVQLAITATEAKLHELDATLADRRKAQDKITAAAQSTVTTTVRGAGGEA